MMENFAGLQESELIYDNWPNSNNPRGCEPRLGVKSAEGAGEVPPWPGGWGHSVSAARGLWEGDLWGETDAQDPWGSACFGNEVESGCHWLSHPHAPVEFRKSKIEQG